MLAAHCLLQEAAEKAGLLGWSDLAAVTFKQNVARKHELGPYTVNTRSAKARSSLSGAASAAAHAAAAVTAEGDGEGAARAAVATLAALTSSHSNGAQPEFRHGSGSGALGEESTAMEIDGAQHAASVGDSNNGGVQSQTVVDWARQTCPLQATNQIVIRDEDLAITLARSTTHRGMPGCVLSAARPAGTCVYKYKMGMYVPLGSGGSSS